MQALKRRLNAAGKTHEGKEFYRTDLAGKMKVLRTTSLGLPVLTEFMRKQGNPSTMRVELCEKSSNSLYLLPL